MHNNTIEPKLALAKTKTKARPLEEINVDKEHKMGRKLITLFAMGWVPTRLGCTMLSPTQSSWLHTYGHQITYN
jgi:hypothetical protein